MLYYKIDDIDSSKLSSLFARINVSGSALTKEEIEFAEKYSE